MIDRNASPRLLPVLVTATLTAGLACAPSQSAADDERAEPAAAPQSSLDWQQLPDLPDALGVAGPFVGVHNNALIVAGGANFPKPVWENDKVWHDRIHVLTKTDSGYAWETGGTLDRPIAYGAAVSTPNGIVCMGGNDAAETFRDVFSLRWDPDTRTVTRAEYPQLPRPCAFGQAALVGSVIYLAGGQSAGGLDSAMHNFWALDLSQRDQPTNSSGRNSAPGPAIRAP